jgi:hypothetical protein
MEEIWKDVPLYEGIYQVSNTGKLKSFHGNVAKNSNGFIIREKPDKDGYRRCVLYGNKIKLAVEIHRLVAMMFIPNPENKPCINHKDFNRSNCSVDNLEWVTDKENTKYSRENLFMNNQRRGEIHPRSLFTNKQVAYMRILRSDGMRYSTIAKIYNAKENTILQIFRKGYYQEYDKNH